MTTVDPYNPNDPADPADPRRPDQPDQPAPDGPQPGDEPTGVPGTASTPYEQI